MSDVRRDPPIEDEEPDDLQRVCIPALWNEHGLYEGMDEM